MGSKYNPEFDSLEGLKGLKGINYNQSDNDLINKLKLGDENLNKSLNKPTLTGKQLKTALANEKARAILSANESTVRSLPTEYIGEEYPEVGRSRFDKNVSSLRDIEDINTFRANQQSGLGKFSNAMISGLASGVLTAVQDISLMADLENWAALFTDGIEGVEDNAISKSMKEAKESLYQNMPIYETPGTSTVDKFFKWSSLRGILDSAVGFMIPGAVAGKAAQLGLKGALYATRAARTSQYADMLIDGLGLASKIQKTADITSDTFKVGRAWLKGQDYASSMIGGLISNQAEGVMMAIEEGDNIKARYIEDRAARYLENEVKNNPNFVINDESINSAKQLAEQNFNNNKELQSEIGRRQEHFINRNRIFALSDAFGIHGLFKVGKQASRSLLPPIKSTLQNLGSFSSDNLILQGVKEGAEEIGQQAIQDELGYQVGKKFDFQTPEQKAVNDKDFIGRLSTFAMSDNALVQGMMGFVSGGAQREFMQLLVNSTNGDPFNKKQKEKYQKQLAIQDKLIESYAVDNIKSIMDLQSYADSDDNSKTSSVKQSMARDAGFFRKLTEAFTNGTTASLESNIQAINQMTEEEAASKGFITQAQEDEARKAGDNFTKSYKTLSNEWLNTLSKEENKYNTLLNYNNAGKLIELNLTANSYSKVLNDINNEILKIKSTDQFKNGILSDENISQTKQEELTKLNQEKEVLIAAQDKITDEVRKAKNIADIEQSFKVKESLLNKTIGNTYYSTIEGQELLRLENTAENISSAIRLINKEFNHISSSKYQLSYNQRAEKLQKQAAATIRRYSKEVQEDFQREVSNVEDQINGLSREEKKEAIKTAKEAATQQGNTSFEAVLDAVENNIDLKYSKDREGYSVNNVLLKFDREVSSKITNEEDKKVVEKINQAVKEHREEAGMLEQLSVNELMEKLDKIEETSEILTSLKNELQAIIAKPIINEESVEQQFEVLEKETLDKQQISHVEDKRLKGATPGKVAYQSRKNTRINGVTSASENKISPDYNIAIFDDAKALQPGTTLYFKEEGDSQPFTVGYNNDGTPIVSTWGEVKETRDLIKESPIGIYVKIGDKFHKIGYESSYNKSSAEAKNLYLERKAIIESGKEDNGFYKQTSTIRSIDNGVISERVNDTRKYVTLNTLNNKELRVLVRRGNSDNNAGINTAGKNSVNYNISNGTSLIAGYTYIGLPKNFNGEIEAVPVFRNKLEGATYLAMRESIKNSILLYLKLINTPMNELSTSENNFVQGLIKLTNDSQLGKEFITYDKGNYKFTLDNLTNYLKLFITITPASQHSLLKTLRTKQIKNEDLVLNAISLERQNRKNADGTSNEVSVISLGNTNGESYELLVNSKGNTYFTENKTIVKDGNTSQFLAKLDTILPTMMFNIDKGYLGSKDHKFTLPLLSQGLATEQQYNSYQDYIKNHLQTFVLETQYKGLDGKQHFSYTEQRQVLFNLDKTTPVQESHKTTTPILESEKTKQLTIEENTLLSNLVDDDMIDERSSISLQNNGMIKKGVSELFESNSELANQVYEALGFKEKRNSDIEELLVVDENEIPKKEGESFAEMQKRVTQNINIRKRIEIANKNNIVQGKSYSYSEIKEIFNNDKLFDNEIYDDLQDILSQVTFRFGSLNKSNKTKNGYYDSKNNTINLEILHLKNDDFKRTLLHEIIHAATFINLEEDAILTDIQKTALNNLNNLIEELKKDKDFFGEYGLTNANELLAELANRNFVNKLKKKTFSDNQSFFEKIISEIVKLLGLNTTAYDIVKESFDSLVKEYKPINQITPQQKQQAQQLYSQYLDTIFSDSRVKDIVYHGSTDSNFESFQRNNKGLWFTTKDKADLYQIDRLTGKKSETSGTKSILLNVNNPFIFDTTNKNASLYLDKLKNKENDTLIGEDYRENSKDYVVFEPEQIHILGSQADTENFANFVAYENSDFSKIGNINQFRDYIMSKNFAAIEEFLVVNNKIDRKC